jgi:hypothetical protein
MTPEMIAEICEAAMIVCFGLSWPLSVYKSWKSRTAKGKSLQFEVFIWIGYIFGIAKNFIKFANGGAGFLFFLAWGLYFLNFIEITIDIALYFRNRKLDRARELQKTA